jgi:hypothetical protein
MSNHSLSAWAPLWIEAGQIPVMCVRVLPGGFAVLHDLGPNAFRGRDGGL